LLRSPWFAGSVRSFGRKTDRSDRQQGNHFAFCRIERKRLLYLFGTFTGCHVGYSADYRSELASNCISCHNTIVAEFTPLEHVKKAYSLSYLGLNLGYAIGPMLGTFCLPITYL
jgi:hypothetical protein